MAEDRQAPMIAIRLDFLHLADCKDNRLFSALALQQAACI
jgi:hypothetical protein